MVVVQFEVFFFFGPCSATRLGAIRIAVENTKAGE
jgi:hypothetical protein